MKIINQDCISRSGKQVNEDIATISSNSAWVLDGATGLSKEKLTKSDSDALWFVEQWNDYLKNHIDSNKDLKEIIKNGIVHMKEQFESITSKSLDPLDLPSSGIALIRWYQDQIDYFVLGDCSISILDDDLKVFTDKTLEALDQKVIHRLHELMKDQKLSFLEAREHVQDILIKHRNLKNTTDGYWILGFNEEAVHHAIVGTIQMKKPAILLMSDGFSALIDKYHATDLHALFSKLDTRSLESFYHQIREIEQNDSEGIRYPRLKQSDDASAIYLKLSDE